MSHQITYGLRDRSTGRLVRVTDPLGDPGNSSSRTLVAGDGFDNDPILEFSDLSDLIGTLQENTKYYNSTRTRPSWGNVDAPACIPVAIIREEQFDAGGGDPVLSVLRLRKAVLPRHFAGDVLRTREVAPLGILRRAFGSAFDGTTGEQHEIAVVDVTSESMEVGMSFTSARANVLEAAAVVLVPEDWPITSPHSVIWGPQHRLVLGKTVASVAIVEFDDEDFTPSSTPIP